MRDFAFQQHQTINAFSVPSDLEASEPPEIRGFSRSDVRLLVVNRFTGLIQHAKFEEFGKFLNAGDLIVFNSSRTLPASLVGKDMKSGKEIEVRLAEHLPDDTWLALLLDRKELKKRPLRFEPSLFGGMWIKFGEGLSCSVDSQSGDNPRLWKIRFSTSGSEVTSLIYDLGKPIRYEHVPLPWKIDYFQNIYSGKPGSSEMPSAGRAFTWKMIFELKKAGIETTSILLHTGLSSYMDEELDASHAISEEEYTIKSEAARKINEVRSRRSRVIVIGTTVVRALESASTSDGTVNQKHGYTRLHVTRNHKLKSVDGLLTGLHEPSASHLDLLQAFLSEKLLYRAYGEALAQGYLWHEFGDLNLII